MGPPNDSDSRLGTPNGMTPTRTKLASAIQSNSRSFAQGSSSHRTQISSLGHLDRDRNSTPRRPPAIIYDYDQENFTPGRNEDLDSRYAEYGRDSPYIQDEEHDGRTVFGGRPYAPATQFGSMGNGGGLGDYEHRYNGYQSSVVGSPALERMGSMPNGNERTASRSRAEHYSNSNGHHRSMSCAGPSFPQSPPEHVVPEPSIYPQFIDGNVRIISPSGKIWKLHSIILSKASPMLAKLFARTPPLYANSRRKRDVNSVDWEIKMVPDRRAQGIDAEGLNFMSFSKINIKDKSLAMISNMNGLGEEAGFNKIYDNFFRCLYNMEPKFMNDGDKLARPLIYDATMLLQAATWLDAVPCVRLVVEANLLRLHQALWKHITDKPEGWIHIAARLESPLIFRECLIHLVGRYHLENGINEQFLCKKTHGPLTEKIWALIVQKAKELKDKKLRVERVLMEFFPIRMVHKEDTETIPGRAIYAADIYLWQALVVFRQFISSAFFSNFHHKAKDGGLAFYRTIGAADATYLRADTLDLFHQSFDMSPKSKHLLLAALEQIKAEAKNVVAELLHDRSQLTRSPTDKPCDHLTCIEVLDEEMPWVVAEDEDIDDDELDLDTDMGHGY
ncbi:hypothetical protein IFR05_011124 [Cadophora sp. M221]|nr:hypothetical protein IFR05_011124 [Cadophora sp. M221]